MPYWLRLSDSRDRDELRGSNERIARTILLDRPNERKLDPPDHFSITKPLPLLSVDRRFSTSDVFCFTTPYGVLHSPSSITHLFPLSVFNFDMSALRVVGLGFQGLARGKREKGKMGKWENEISTRRSIRNNIQPNLKSGKVLRTE